MKQKPAAYGGPIIDAHMHLWVYESTRYPWLSAEKLAPLRQDYLPDDYWQPAHANGIVASVHVEAGRRVDESLDETRWLTKLVRPPGVADRLVVHVPLFHEAAEKLLAEQAAVEGVVGVRDILLWHPQRGKSHAADCQWMDNELWRRNFSALESAQLTFDLMISPWQAEEAVRLARAFPSVKIAVNHCGCPFDRQTGGHELWRKSLTTMSAAPNLMIKISDPMDYDPGWTLEGVRDVIRMSIDAFGPKRAMFGSDFPLSRLYLGFADWLGTFSVAVSDLSTEEQADVFFNTARNFYRL